MHDHYPKQSILFKHQAYQKLRSYLNNQGFIEVSTPYIIKANAPDPFIDPITINSQNTKHGWQLHTSPELWLKKSMVLGFDKIYELGRVFRDDPEGDHHLIEFDMLEWYRCHSCIDDLINDCKEIVKLFVVAFNETFGQNQKEQRSLDMIFERSSVADLFFKYAHLDLNDILEKTQTTPDYFPQLLQKKGEHLPVNAEFEDAFFHIMVKYVEANLPKDRFVFIERWPLQLAALSAPCLDDSKYCDRFEMYYGGLEIANAYKECNDESLLRSRFMAENNKRKKLNKPAFTLDEVFLSSVSKLSTMCGIAMGTDRLMMAIAKKKSIKMIFFGA